MPFSAQTQDDFGGGIYRGRKAPTASFYDAVNALINDEGLPYRRSTTSYLTTSDAGETLAGLGVGYCAAPTANRVLAWNTGLHVVSGSGWVTLAAAGSYPAVNQPLPGSRMAAVAGALVWPAKNAQAIVVAYGGSLKSSAYTTGTATVTNGSKTVTGAGTSWSANADAGMLLQVVSSTGQTAMPVVERINSNTSLTLLYPWTGTTAAATAYSLTPAEGIISAEQTMQAAGVPFSSLGQTVTTPTYVASVARRLLVANANVVAFSDIDGPRSFATSNFHTMPVDAYILGLDGMNDIAFVFTTRGVYAIENMLLDPVDAFGNIQQSVKLVNKDLVLWGDPGIAGWTSGMVVPAIDDVFVLGPDGSTTAISESIRPLYRSYVKAGYQPGTATVHRGHYFLPILNGSSLVDVLVCRLDRNAAWTTWAGNAASGWYATQVGSTTRSPKVFALASQRVVDVTDCFDPSVSNATDADGTTSDFQITTSDYPTGQSQPGFAAKVRARYELDSTNVATVAVAFSSDQDDDAFTTLTERGEQDGGTGWADSDGSRYQWAIVGKRRERIRFRLTVAGACTRFVLRSVELLTRPSGKQ